MILHAGWVYYLLHQGEHTLEANVGLLSRGIRKKLS